MVEQLICNQQVGGSSPSTSSILCLGVFPSGQRGQTVNLLRFASVVRIHPRPPNKAVSKDAAFLFYVEFLIEKPPDTQAAFTYLSAGNDVVKIHRRHLIEDYALDGITGLQSLTIPESVTSIGIYALSSNDFTSLVIPDSVTEIKEYALYGNDKLADITLPKGLLLRFLLLQ